MRGVSNAAPEARLAALLSRTDIGPDGACWVWHGDKTSAGYGMMRVNRRKTYTHRVSYELHVGPIPEGLTIDHLCRNRLCLNPAHLEPVTAAENTRRGFALITHCPRGHAYDSANTAITRSGSRRCRTCDRAHCRHQHARRLARRQN